MRELGAEWRARPGASGFFKVTASPKLWPPEARPGASPSTPPPAPLAGCLGPLPGVPHRGSKTERPGCCRVDAEFAGSFRKILDLHLQGP